MAHGSSDIDNQEGGGASCTSAAGCLGKLRLSHRPPGRASPTTAAGCPSDLRPPPLALESSRGDFSSGDDDKSSSPTVKEVAMTREKGGEAVSV
uniref:Uncharacterized protein n=1 Tax=Oryza sativa subsp. japonica TaxID=39947 RepID=Q8LML6_ORYSJ|nr:hypothetical protein [Oryza sativa Japonica Group]